MKRPDCRYLYNFKYPNNTKGSNLFLDKHIHENEAKYELVFQHAPIGLIHFDKEGVITSCNDAFIKIMGSSYQKIIGMEIAKLPDKRVVGLLMDAMKGQFGNLEGMYTSVSGQKPIYGRLNFQPIMDIDGQVLGGVGILEDITERTEYELRLEYLSQSDPVTGLFNRAYFEQYLESLNTGLFKDQLAAIVCDIDDLKLINDTMGHAAGDRLLTAAGKILKMSSPEDSVVARIGGDEFAILITAGDFDSIKSFEQKLEENIIMHNSVNPDIPVSLSYGYAISEKNHTDMKALLREADFFMYREKIQHRRNSRRSIVRSFMQTWQSSAYLCEEKTERLKNYVKGFCQALDLSAVAQNYIIGLVDYHDIGKVGMDNSPVFKEFRDNEETEIDIQKHCEIGYRIALSSDDIAILANAILKHHEFWNGKGYPLGLKGQEIPLECRVFSIIKAYDEIVNEQPNNQSLTQEQAIKALQAMAGVELDPALTTIYIGILKEQI